MINDQTEQNASKAVEVAVEGLLIALDNTPRSQWRHSIKSAMDSVKKLGYGEGYRVGFREYEKAAFKAAQNAPAEPAPQVSSTIASPYPPAYGGEDKALANSKPTPEEEMEDLGFQFIREIAKQIGREALALGYKPQETKVLVRHDGELILTLKR